MPEENENIPVEETKKPPTKTKTSAVEAKVIKKAMGVYSTEYFKRNNIPYCQNCGAQYQTNQTGEPVCAENFSKDNCPRLGN